MRLTEKRWKMLQRLSDDQKRFLRFASVGAVNTAASFLVYIVLLHFQVYYIIASILAYITGIGISYILNTAFVFKAEKKRSTVYKFTAVYLSALLINLSLLYLFVDIFGMNPVLGQIMVTSAVLFYNYVLQSMWTFKRP